MSTKVNEVIEPSVEVKPVAWKEETVWNEDARKFEKKVTALKFQGFVSITRPDGTERTMAGDPRTTEDEAIKGLKCELEQRRSDVNVALEAVRAFSKQRKDESYEGVH